MRRLTEHSFLSASVKALCVDPAEVHKIWPRVSHWMREALERGDCGTFGALERDVLSGRALLWLAWDDPKIVGAAVTQIAQFEKSKACSVQACGGEHAADWLHLLDDIETYAKDQGCNSMRIVGRRGWQRVLPNYRTTKIVLERRL